MTTPRQRMLPKVFSPVPDYLQRFGAIWTHTFHLSASDVDHGVGCGLLQSQHVEFGGQYPCLLLPGPHVRQYLPATAAFRRPPVLHKATELACLADIERRYLRDGKQSTVDRRRRGLKTSDAEDTTIIVMVRSIAPALWTLRRNMAELISADYRTLKDPIDRRETLSPLRGAEALILYVPAAALATLTKSAEAAGLLRFGELKIRGMTAETWPPDDL